MSAIFDHLVAIIVGAVLVGTLLFVQTRRQESAVETTVRNRVEWHADEFLSVVQRDMENMSTVEQAQHAFGKDRFTIRRRQGKDGAWYTQQVSFPTLAEPGTGTASPLAIVSYEMAPTGQTVRVGTSNRPTYTITRYEYRRGRTVRATGGAVGVLEFNVILVNRDGSEEGGARDSTRRSDVAAQAKVSVMAAAPLGRRAADQATTTMQNAVRRATTVRVISASATGGDPAVDPGPAGVPPFPADPPPPPPKPPPPKTPPSDPQPQPQPQLPPPSPAPSGPRTPPPPPPSKTPPPPPPGRDI